MDAEFSLLRDEGATAKPAWSFRWPPSALARDTFSILSQNVHNQNITIMVRKKVFYRETFVPSLGHQTVETAIPRVSPGISQEKKERAKFWY